MTRTPATQARMDRLRVAAEMIRDADPGLADHVLSSVEELDSEEREACSLVDMFDPDPADAALALCAAPLEPHAPVKSTFNRCDDDMVTALESWSVRSHDDVPGFLECKAELELMLELETANPEPPPWKTVEELLNDLRRRVAHMRAVERSALAYRFTLR